MPILKQLVSSSVHSKRRSRVDLTAEMISAPLGDFRHTMHVGRAGDAFGDTSFLNSKAGELDVESVDERASSSSSSKRGLLSRKFRGSKRSQSVSRGDREQRGVLGPLRDSALFVKSAMSLPQLNEKEAAEKGSGKLPKSLSSSPVRKAAGEGGLEEAVPRRNGASAPHSPDPLLDEQAFGDLADLPVVPKASFGLKHAESIMSFHIDLGPSMLGDVLSVMDKGEWEPAEEAAAVGYHGDEDPAGRPTQAPPTVAAAPPLARQEGAGGPDLPAPPSRALPEEGWAAVAPSPGSARSVGSHTTRDSSSLSSCTSGVLEERSPAFRGPDRARATLPRQPDPEFSFMDEEEEDEIRV
ncbi:cdc42 effector protein 4 [Physeter macrocephalus]|uniref:Cdc42 effector protein 4 n=1 Tax=Physeter macrocephalus TaxID=9755 RepID=A0A2Y9T465_PHYMC|nr:cdc42 effector protein 4 [Physeter catodon]XP_028355444.1 cdc42 effector protein 4 [Physeter catodon]XP_028355445.1 cdc42 effector protein 4 [Physeter catodon]XP_028355446.1 cdc42 effector protein 4 [Physeter catodon]|eukprot:XP_023985761.1 cdc42 effector protein 4 [Physeter catodon]